MGIIIRQSIQNTLLSYAGAGLGILNVMFLMPRLMEDERVGYIQLTNSVAMLLSVVILFGLSSGLLRYYPKFSRQGRLAALFRFLAHTLLRVALPLAVAYLLLWPVAHHLLQARSPLFLAYYPIALALGMVLAVVGMLEAILQSNLQTSVPLFLREVCLRLGITLLLLLYATHGFPFQVFVYAYLGLHLLLLFFIWRRARLLLWQPAAPPLRPRERRGLLRYSLHSLASAGSIILVFELDKIMIGSLVGEAQVAYYSLFIAMATAIALPSRAFLRIGLPLVAQAWQRMDMPYLRRIYVQSSLVNTTLCSLLLLLVLANRDALAGHLLKPSYAAFFDVFYLLAASMWLNILFGVNHYLLNTSRKYVYELYSNLLLLLLALGANLLLIPLWGMRGAALATLLSMACTNLLKSAWLYRFYGLQPFVPAHLRLVAAVLVGGAVAWWLPSFHWLADLFWKSAVVAGIYLPLVYRLHISEELNGLIRRLLPTPRHRQG